MLYEMLACIKRHDSDGGSTFVDLEENFERHGIDYKGAFCCAMKESKEPGKVYFWEGWSAEVFYLLGLLSQEGLIEKHCVNKIFYETQGRGMALPVIKNLNDMKTTGWMPIVFKMTPLGKATLMAV
ncbi:MAG: hypothetical protein RR614_00325 [Eubacterium sp.]